MTLKTGLWKNKYKEPGDRKPDLTARTEGHEFALWWNGPQSDDRKPSASLSIKPIEEKRSPREQPAYNNPEVDDSDVPF